MSIASLKSLVPMDCTGDSLQINFFQTQLQKCKVTNTSRKERAYRGEKRADNKGLTNTKEYNVPIFALNKPPAKLTLKQSRDTFLNPIVTNTHHDRRGGVQANTDIYRPCQHLASDLLTVLGRTFR